MTLEELEQHAGLLGLSLSREQLEQLLPEVQRLAEHGAQLRQLPLDPDEPPLRVAIP